jgi:hypothetical protein
VQIRDRVRLRRGLTLCALADTVKAPQPKRVVTLKNGEHYVSEDEVRRGLNKRLNKSLTSGGGLCRSARRWKANLGCRGMQ